MQDEETPAKPNPADKQQPSQQSAPANDGEGADPSSDIAKQNPGETTLADLTSE